ncbi:MAG: hypothetical protein GY755_04770 [Chloroflexi bacterium]|nr:hypothetical protein [Chloroflexota bacterium]
MSKNQKEEEATNELKGLLKDLAKSVGAGLVIGITWPFVLAFFLMNPAISAVAVVAVVKAKINNEDALKAGKEAGITAAAVKAIEVFLKSLGMG